MSHKLTFSPLSDSSGCSYTLTENGQFVKKYFVTYGYCTPAWQKKEKRDTEAMCKDLEERGLDFAVLNAPNLAH